MNGSRNVPSWVTPWAKKQAKKSLSHIDYNDRLQEIMLVYLSNAQRVAEIEGSQGEIAAQSYLGVICNNHLMNLNANLTSQLSGMNGATRNSEGDDVKRLKRQAMTGGVSLDQPLDSDGSNLSEIVGSDALSIENMIFEQGLIEAAGILAPILTKDVDHPQEWCQKFPAAGKLFVQSLALRRMAVREACKGLAEYLQMDHEKLVEFFMEYLSKWRGARGEYGDQDEVFDVEFHPSQEMAEVLGLDTVLGKIAQRLPLNQIKEFVPGFGDHFIDLCEEEANAFVNKIDISAKDKEEFKVRIVNYARSYLKAQGGFETYDSVMEKMQRPLFNF